MDRGMEGGRKKGRTGLDDGEFAPRSWGMDAPEATHKTEKEHS